MPQNKTQQGGLKMSQKQAKESRRQARRDREALIKYFIDQLLAEPFKTA